MRFLIQVNYLADTNCNFILTPQTTPPPYSTVTTTVTPTKVIQLQKTMTRIQIMV